jgi:hypothetical protein
MSILKFKLSKFDLLEVKSDYVHLNLNSKLERIQGTYAYLGYNNSTCTNVKCAPQGNQLCPPPNHDCGVSNHAC